MRDADMKPSRGEDRTGPFLGGVHWPHCLISPGPTLSWSLGESPATCPVFIHLWPCPSLHGQLTSGGSTFSPGSWRWWLPPKFFQQMTGAGWSCHPVIQAKPEAAHSPQAEEPPGSPRTSSPWPRQRPLWCSFGSKPRQAPGTLQTHPVLPVCPHAMDKAVRKLGARCSFHSPQPRSHPVLPCCTWQDSLCTHNAFY